MRILSVVYDLDKGGVQKTALNFAVGFAELGHTSELLVQDQEGTLLPEALDAPIALHSQLEWMSLECPNYDLVYFHSLKLDTEFVHSICNEVRMANPKAQFIEKSVFSRPSPWEPLLDVVVQMSEWCAFNYYTNGGIKPSVVVNHPADHQKYFPASEPEVGQFLAKHKIPTEAKILLRVGQAYSIKWSKSLVEIFAELHAEDSSYFLLMVAPPDDLVEMVSVLPSEVRESIQIIDRIESNDEMRACYSVADLFVHISLQGESFGNVFLEASLCELPVLAVSTPWRDNSQIEVIGAYCSGGICHTYRQVKDAIQMFFVSRAEFDELFCVNNERGQIMDNQDAARGLLGLLQDTSAVESKVFKPLDCLCAGPYLPPVGLRLLVLLRAYVPFYLIKKALRRLSERLYKL